MNWANVCKQTVDRNPLQCTYINKNKNINQIKTYLDKTIQHKQNVLPIFVMIEYFQKICHNNGLSNALSNQLSYIILPYLLPYPNCFTDYYQKVIYKNQYFNTVDGVKIRNVIHNAHHNKGFDIVSTWGLSSKIFNNYFRNKYFQVNYIGVDGLDINFFEDLYDALDDYWTFKLKLRVPALNLLLEKSKNIDEFRKNLIEHYIQKNIFIKKIEYETITNLKNNRLQLIYHILNKYRVTNKH